MAAHAAPASAPRVRPAAAPAPRHERPHLRVVDAPKPRRQLRTGPTFALGALLAFAIALAVVACQVVLVQGQQRLDRLDADIATATDRYQQLRLEVARLESPARIVDAATNTLGMVPPPEVTYLTPTGAISVPSAAAVDPAASVDELAAHAETRPNLDN
jgi:cell division protein FtsL